MKNFNINKLTTEQKIERIKDEILDKNKCKILTKKLMDYILLDDKQKTGN